YKSLKPKGKYVTVGGKLGSLLVLALWNVLFSYFTNKKLQILSLKPNKGLQHIEALYLQNKLECTIDGPYSFEELPGLVRYFGEGKHTGKIVAKI
ncbi:MAG: zinc-binding dehydrogenase, partial [Allomuricauda sp.]